MGKKVSLWKLTHRRVRVETEGTTSCRDERAKADPEQEQWFQVQTRKQVDQQTAAEEAAPAVEG